MAVAQVGQVLMVIIDPGVDDVNVDTGASRIIVVSDRSGADPIDTPGNLL